MADESSFRNRRRGRLFCLAAAVLWSVSALFTRILQNPTPLALDEPRLGSIGIAFYRALFAGLFLLPLLRRKEVRFRPLIPVMVVIFAAMNAFYLTAISEGSAASAVFLQYMAPFLVYLIGVHLLGEPADPRTWHAILVAMGGVLVIVLSGLNSAAAVPATLLALGSGVCYALVITCLRQLNRESSIWLTVLNQLGSACCIGTGVLLLNGPTEWLAWLALPTLRQFAFLALFGSLQMGFSYYFFSRGLKLITPQEAGFITLLEPILSPIWVFVVFGEQNPPAVYIGGGLILFALAWRYSRPD